MSEVSEIMGLRWEKVDFEKNEIKIDTNLLYSPARGIYVDSTKTENAVRTVKLPAETMKLLRDYRRWYLERCLLMGDRWQDSGFLFVKDNGLPMIPDSITAWLGKFSERHNLPHIHPHTFRHTVASILIQKGVDDITHLNWFLLNFLQFIYIVEIANIILSLFRPRRRGPLFYWTAPLSISVTSISANSRL